MSLISWNCRGLGNPQTVRDLSHMVREKKPNILFLMETICSRKKMEWIRVKLRFVGLFAVDPVGRSGGIALLWKEEHEVEIQNYSRRHINAIEKRNEDGFIWKLTGFYGNPDSSKRKESWALLQHLKSFLPEAWMCVGDFIEITHQEEKTGEARRRETLMADFWSALEVCNLWDLGFIGPRFTWSNRRTDGVLTQVRLDRAVANSKWCQRFEEAEVYVFAARASDHNPLMVQFEKKQPRSYSGAKGFKFEDQWWLDPDCGNIIKQGGRPEDQEEIKKLQADIDQLLEHEDIKWKQRAKQHWDVEECLEGLEARVTPEMNGWLLRRFVAEEVDVALAQMGPLKSPGPDGFAACFYQKSWDILRSKVCGAVLEFLNEGMFTDEINGTYIALIPKIKNPLHITDFRPISLCNVSYKLIAKVLANRMKKVLGDIISPNQSAFILGRLITDNVIIAFEALHTMDTRLKGKEGYMALKLDMSKAYDRVEWGFLEAVMKRIGFAPRWVQLLMTCVKTVNYSILINGRPYRKITPSRGLRQGDPLSPYFFILCAEGLSTGLNKMEQAGGITGLPLTRGGTRLNHLFFADDSLLFCKADMVEWYCIQKVLNDYEQASGQKLNRGKTSLFFSRNTPMDARTQIMSVAEINSTQRYEKYLGLPALIGKSKVSSLAGIKGWIWEKMHGWKEKFLSQAGKEVLLKAVVQAIPTYTMSVFLLPKTLCKDINLMMAKFWWGHKSNDKKVAWMSWEKMRKAKEKGGMGFRDLECFNIALLAKQGWRLTQNPDSSVAKILKEKYHPNGTFLDTPLSKKPSYVWRSIWHAKTLLNEGLVWRVGNGKGIKIWGDKWLFSPTTYAIQSSVRILSENARVSALIDQELQWWNIPLIKEIFLDEEVHQICSIAICPQTQQDRLVWSGTKNGLFSVKSVYHLAIDLYNRGAGGCSSGDKLAPFWKQIWCISAPRVVSLFIWQACNNILPTKGNLFKRKIATDPLCPICCMEEEIVGHVLWSCPAARDVWMEGNVKIHKSSSDEDTFCHILQKLSERLTGDDFDLVACVARQIWLRRNRVVF
ncbi:uncharacterized protein LOC132177129 [Corylus avellana]|uniref:uncharacterized protein LOC132177129 n=1 Tax=Corylus avellana TaxID=13451 RepID=UPI00286A0825|nr:uncharacterized protein LOC132177129 [Corylus avellana]